MKKVKVLEGALEGKTIEVDDELAARYEQDGAGQIVQSAKSSTTKDTAELREKAEAKRNKVAEREAEHPEPAEG